MTIDTFKKRLAANGIDENSDASKELYNLLNWAYIVSKPALTIGEDKAEQIIEEMISTAGKLNIGLAVFNNSKDLDPKQTSIKLSRRGCKQRFDYV